MERNKRNGMAVGGGTVGPSVGSGVVMVLLMIVMTVACSTPRPDRVVPYGTVRGQYEKLDEGRRVRMVALGAAETAHEAQFLALEAACLTVVAPEKIDLPIAKLRGHHGDAWRIIVTAVCAPETEWQPTSDPPSIAGGVRQFATVTVDLVALLRRLTELAQTPPTPQTQPTAADTDSAGTDNTGGGDSGTGSGDDTSTGGGTSE